MVESQSPGVLQAITTPRASSPSVWRSVMDAPSVKKANVVLPEAFRPAPGQGRGLELGAQVLGVVVNGLDGDVGMRFHVPGQQRIHDRALLGIPLLPEHQVDGSGRGVVPAPAAAGNQ